MNYETMVKEAYEEIMGFDKEAAARWKKEFGNLSEGAKDTLKKKVAKSSEDMVKGIERGNKVLAKKLNVDIVSNHNGRAIRKFLKNEKSDYQNPIKRYLSGKLISMNGAVTIPGEKEKTLITGFKRGLTNKDGQKMTSHQVKKLFYAKDPELGRMSRADKRAVDTLTLRHELDEVRSIKKNGVLMGYSSHNAPDVIHRESANLALMPEKVKRAYTGLRKENPVVRNRLFKGVEKRTLGGELIRGGEAESLAKRGIKYGDSPYYNKKISKAHVHDFINGKDHIEGARIK